MLKNSIRCCISCILPCGSLDVIRIVHANGRVEEINRMVRAADIMEAYPNHVLKNVLSSALKPKAIVIMPPEAQLQRGKIYFLVPAPPPNRRRRRRRRRRRKTNAKLLLDETSTNNQHYRASTRLRSVIGNTDNSVDKDKQLSMKSDRYLTEILSTEKVISTGNEFRRRGRTGIWRPHLESILETPSLV